MNIDQVARAALTCLNHAARLVMTATDNPQQKVKALEGIKEAVEQFSWVTVNGTPNTVSAYHDAGEQVDISLYETRKRMGSEIVPIVSGRDRYTQRGNVQHGRSFHGHMTR